jgi:hypothetical protein
MFARLIAKKKPTVAASSGILWRRLVSGSAESDEATIVGRGLTGSRSRYRNPRGINYRQMMQVSFSYLSALGAAALAKRLDFSSKSGVIVGQ